MDLSIDKIVEEEIKLANTRIEEELKLTATRVEEIWKLTTTKLVTRIKSFVEAGTQSSPQRSMKLQFRNKISRPILTGEEIKGEGDTSIEVTLVDVFTGNIVDVGPESSANVEIVALRAKFDDLEGGLTVEEFNDKIVQNTEGTKPLLSGNLSVKLQNGIAVLDNIKFRHYASKIKPSLFRLRARFVETFVGVHVMEAKTESFVVKDFREKYYKKHNIPSLSDEVWRLKNIRKGGKIYKRLQAVKIYTMEEFLVQLLINPEGLKRTVNMAAKKWDVTVNHARATPSAHKMYCYINSEQKKGIVFSLLGQVLGLYLKDQYLPSNELSENHKDDVKKLKASALEHWDHIIPCNDENAIHQQFSNLKTDCDRTLASEIGESSNRNSNSSFLHYSRETGIEYFGPFNIFDDMESMIEDFDMHYQNGPTDEPNIGLERTEKATKRELNSHLPINAQSMNIGDFDMDYQNGLTDEPNVDQERAEKATKMWTKLFCVTMWFLVMKGVALKDCRRYTKKQRVF